MVMPRTLLSWRGLAVVLLFVVFGGACAHSPQEELAKARAQFAELEQSGAAHYVLEDIQAIRSLLQHAELRIRANQFMLAQKEIQKSLLLIHQASQAFRERKANAEKESSQLIARFSDDLRYCLEHLKGMPRLTYVDQNRFDIVRFRLKGLRKRLQLFREYYGARQYLAILKEAPEVQQQFAFVKQLIEQSLQQKTTVTRAEYRQPVERESRTEDTEGGSLLAER